MTTLVLVYQGGIANVFELSDKGQKRILQASFNECEWFMRGAQYAGADVDVAGCNMAGDIANMAWTRNLELLPFHDKFGCAWMQKQNSAV
jgi:hypothetical protein